jgi:Leucine-rich repeat (LRR) protein
MRKQEAAAQQQAPPLEPELFAALLAAMTSENTRAAVEYSGFPHEERDAAWEASPHHVGNLRSDYPQKYAPFAAENPLPAIVFARNRLAQTRGTLFVAFRGCQPSIDWTGHVVVAERVVVYLYNKGLSGTVDLTQLPQSLQLLHLGSNQLSGDVNLAQLPQSLRELWLYNNQLSGVCNLTQLPQSLQTLRLDSNQLSGTVDLTLLPQSLQQLDLCYNLLSGTVDLTQLPQSLQELWLGDNQLSGPVDLTQLPQSLQTLGLSDNQLSGTVQRSMLSRSLHFFADNSGLTVVP